MFNLMQSQDDITIDCGAAVAIDYFAIMPA